MRKIGINLDAAGAISAEDCVKIIKELGFEAAFITPRPDGQILHEAELLARAGISLDTIHAPWKGINDIWLSGDAGEMPLGAFEHYVDMCKETGAPVLIVHLSSGANPPPVTDIGRARFTKLVDYALGKGITLAFENQRMLSNLAWVFEEFKEAKNVGFCWDVGHEMCFTAGRRYMPLFGDKLVATHIHDNDCVYDHDYHMIPFDGKIDFSRVADEIKASGFDGTLMFELIKKHDIYTELTAERYLERAASAAKRFRDMLQ
ncbi:MAG: sugar phosphate isomerase/epimerase [Clostridia bacterium]|nr:sugar phosphate isomerase/epimerase [Clostridia bacterium]